MSTRKSPGQGSVVAIKRKGKVIAYQARVPYRDDLGFTRRMTSNQPTRRAAERERARMVNARDGGRGLDKPERRTIAEEVTHWLTTVKRGKVRNTTLAAYSERMQRYVIPYIGHIDVTALRRHHCETWQRKLQDRGLSNTFINSITDIVGQMLERMVPDILPVNVARIERLPRVPAVRTALTPEQVDAVIAAASPWFQPIVTILFWTGLRNGELAALRLPDVFEAHPRLPHIRVTGSRYEIGTVRGIHAPKTAAGLRVIPLLPPAAAALRAMRQEHIRQLQAFGTEWNPEQFVFLTKQTGRPYGHSSFYMAWRHALKAAGLPPLPLHTTRHTTATLLLAADVPARIQTAILGHVSLSQTYEYQHPDLAMLTSGMARVQAYLEARTEDDDTGR